jgi:hypothetical protein
MRMPLYFAECDSDVFLTSTRPYIPLEMSLFVLDVTTLDGELPRMPRSRMPVHMVQVVMGYISEMIYVFVVLLCFAGRLDLNYAFRLLLA